MNSAKQQIERDPDEVQKWIDTINEMIESGEFTRQEEYLLNVGEWIEENGVITENIQNRILEIRSEN